MNHTFPEALQQLRRHAGDKQTEGLPDTAILAFYEKDPHLRSAIERAGLAFSSMSCEIQALLALAEKDICAELQDGFLNFYGDQARSPYVPLSAVGPWIVTTHGSVLHDSGGYGMLGAGHAPASVLKVLSEPLVMANVMTPSLSQKRFLEKLRAEIGQQRGRCPFDRFVCLNSGSESVTMAGRLSDLHAHRLTKPNGRQAGKRTKYLSLEGSFHGRTEPATKVSDATMKTYRSHLASFRNYDSLVVVPVNDMLALQTAYDTAARDGVYFEAFFIEPVLGEGKPGVALRRDFYDLARKLTTKHDTLLVVDSIQAGLRTSGYLSIVDYPGFEDCLPPDMETYSKALNAGQYPLSVLAMTQAVADGYVPGVYGNTMTTNPRALEVGIAVLESITPQVRLNIRQRGDELLHKLKKLAEEFPHVITEVNGTGLMLAVEIAEQFPVCGSGGLEQSLRMNGIMMIHAGSNALRLTPHFQITSGEIDLIVSVIRNTIQQECAKQ